MLHLLFNEMNISQSNDYISFANSGKYYLLMGSFYLFGVVIYVTKIPEKFNPGKFDIWVNR